MDVSSGVAAAVLAGAAVLLLLVRRRGHRAPDGDHRLVVFWLLNVAAIDTGAGSLNTIVATVSTMVAVALGILAGSVVPRRSAVTSSPIF
ncbi:hypothetical protein [Microbacterium sp. APC 3901]|uniref:hypothetical protein n=1 Tax=Microbacterium sp. APC 3901 TaxID=3035192 RepID=UPI0025B62263|nr:hypothetical protein [Microbacterium sp. APC 3901]MDN3445506.1 hypothetical protein [Microbacterium sp. APC 3901]